MARVQALLASALSHEWVLRMLTALAIAFIGLWLARVLARALERLMLRFQVEETLRSFLRNVAYSAAVVVALIAALDFAGVPTTSLLAVVGAAGLAIGLALKDSLANIASGVMLIVLHPFRKGDQVQIAGLEGVVDQVRIFQTLLVTGDNRTIILPNSQITAAPITNFTLRGDRRVDIPVGIAYGDDIARARTTLLAIASENKLVKSEPAAAVVVTELAESSVNLQLRVWAYAPDHGTVKTELMEAVYARFGQVGISIPYPQRDLHVYHHDAEGRPLAQLTAAVQDGD